MLTIAIASQLCRITNQSNLHEAVQDAVKQLEGMDILAATARTDHNHVKDVGCHTIFNIMALA